jgi:hypothetical protein
MKAPIVALIVVACCSCASTNVSPWRPNPSLLDARAEALPEESVIRDRLVSLYERVHARDWAAVYDFMTDSFRERIDKKSFVRSSSNDGFVFDGYEVLASRGYKFGQSDYRKRFVIRFEQGGGTTYEVVWWRLENGVWHVENVGLHGLSFDGIGDPSIEGDLRDAIQKPNQSLQPTALLGRG